MKNKLVLKLLSATLAAVLIICGICACAPGDTETTDATSGASTDATSGASTDATSGASTDATSGASIDATSGASEDWTIERDTTPATQPATEAPTEISTSGKVIYAENNLTGAGPQAYEHNVLGKGRGINPGRVTWAYDTSAYAWNGVGYWWKTSRFNETAVKNMFTSSLFALTNKTNDADAWKALFDYNAAERGIEGGYKPGDGIAIKINMNGCNTPLSRTNILYTSAPMLRVVLESMIAAGVPAEDIIVYDCTRVIPDYMQEYCNETCNGVQYKYFAPNTANDCKQATEPILWSEDIKGETSYMPDFVVKSKYLVNMSNMKAHALAGITATTKNLFGSIMNSQRQSAPAAAGLHEYVSASGWDKNDVKMASYSPLVDLMGSAQSGAKTVLYMLEAFICTPSQSTEVSPACKWQMAPFNGDWTNSMLLSQDPVAIDSVAVDFVTNEQSVIDFDDVNMAKTTLQNYLHEAALADNAPSGIKYKDGCGNVIEKSLGVHEHWNNTAEKLYSRNLGYDEGIELYKIFAQ